MTPDELKADFAAWSGGFPPSDEHQITVYLEFAMPLGLPRKREEIEEARQILTEWMSSGG